MSESNANLRVRKGSAILGPFTRDELTRQLVAGTVDAQDLVREGDGRWVPIHRLGEEEESAAAVALDRSLPEDMAAMPTLAVAPGSRHSGPLPSARRLDAAATTLPSRIRPPDSPPPASPPAPPGLAHWQPTLPVVLAIGFGFLFVGLFGAYVIVRSAGPGSSADSQIVRPVGDSVPAVPSVGGSAGPSAPTPIARSENRTPAGAGIQDPTAPVVDPAAAIASKPVADPTEAVALVCGVERNGDDPQSETYLPLFTAWAIDKNHLAARAIWLLKIDAANLLANGATLKAVTPTQVFDIVGLRIHSAFPTESFLQGESTAQDQERMFLNDVALLEVAQDMPATLEPAPAPNLQGVPATGRPVRLLAPTAVDWEFAPQFRPDVVSQPATLYRHPVAPNGHPGLVAVGDVPFHELLDGAPVVGSDGRVLGIVTLNRNRAGQLVGDRHQVLAVQRIQEILDHP